MTKMPATAKKPCKAKVADRTNPRWPRMVPCKRAATRDGYCAQHHPDAARKRQAEREARWKEDLARQSASDEVEAAERQVLYEVRLGNLSKKAIDNLHHADTKLARLGRKL